MKKEYAQPNFRVSRLLSEERLMNGALNNELVISGIGEDYFSDTDD